MFDLYYRSLSQGKRSEFSRNCGLSEQTIRNTYLSKDPLKRRIPRPETMIAMVNASDGYLTFTTLIQYFWMEVIIELCKLDQYYVDKKTMRRAKRLSISHIDEE